MDFGLVGIDCATEDSSMGLAIGRSIAGRAHVDEVLCPGDRPAVAILADWLRAMKRPTLVAMDAPLGWPSRMSSSLVVHRAGQVIDVPPNDFFRRTTDRFIRRHLGKTPLDVGADRIARTAHAALTLLAALRTALDAPIPLAWSADTVSGHAAIEVYPAATLIAHSLPCTGYKKPDQQESRRSLLRCLGAAITLPADVAVCDGSADAVDAIVCVLAAADFANGRVMPPEDPELAEQEGWIWVAPRRGPTVSSESQPLPGSHST